MFSTLTLLVDFGLVVLIWIVQLIVYPSFHVLSDQDFKAWHKTYSLRISVLVMPLMVVQVAFHGIGLYEEASALQIVAALLIAVAWIVTFTLSVPCHNALAATGKSSKVIQRLIRTNWLRTACWSLTFALSIIRLNA